MSSLRPGLTFAPLLLFACSNGSTSTDLASPPMDAAVAGDLAGFQQVEGCAASDYGAVEAGSVTVSPWNTSLGKKCILIHQGGQVTWPASGTHPLEATGGTTPTPIMSATSTVTVTFDAVGVYGFHCGVHTSAMHGAIWVIP